MDKTKQKALNQVYQEFINTCMGNQDIDGLARLVDENIFGFGSAVDEKIQGLEGVKKLLQNQLDQSFGIQITWKIDPFSRFISQDENTAIFADDVLMTIHTGEEEVVMSLRLSIVLNFVNKKWKVIHWHGSKPEEVESEKDTWGIENWKQKAEELESLVAEKTSDLVKKNRELEIEAALERVRARTMAMHRSDELAEASMLLEKEIRKLGVENWGCAFHIYDEETTEGTPWDLEWFTSLAGFLPFYKTPREHFFLTYYEESKKGNPLYIQEYGPEVIKQHYDYLKTLPVLGEALTDLHKSGVPLPDKQIDHVAFGKHGHLLFITYKPVPEAHDIFIRFAKVFDQTYTRFLELQKAEAQTREAEIQLALERVRAKSLAMQRSEELIETSLELWKQVEHLGIPAFACGFNIWDSDKKFATAWMGGKDRTQPPFKTESEKDIFKRIYEAEQKGKELFIEVQEGKALKEHYAYMNSIPVFKEIFNQNASVGISIPDFQIMHCSFFEQGYLMFITYKPVPEAHDIFIRFAKVFEQTYTRFLDLHKAEAQAREAMIEAALERVRAKAMAMHSSEMVGEAINKLFQELEELGFESFVNGLNIIHPDCKMESWSAAVGNEGVFIAGGIIDMNHHPGTRKLFEDWEQKKNTHITHIQGPEVEAFFQSIYAQDTFEAPIYLTSFPDELYLNNVIIPEGSLWVMTEKELSKDHFQILSRFAKVFSLTYTRYKDLQKAEAQAREAQIEVALEKIRNRTLLMKDSAELNETVSVFFQQFDLLELLPKEARTYFSHVDTNTDTVEVWMTHADGRVMSGSHFTPLNQSAQLKAFYTKWKEDRGIINIRIYQEEDLANYMAFLATLPHVAQDEDYQKLFKSPPDQIVMTDAGFLQGFLGIMSFEPLKKEAIEILSRFAKAFEFTYTRFLDLQKAEAQAREALIEAALERVRSRTMAMQHSSELSEAANLLFNQIQTLDAPSWTAGYCIWDEDKKAVTLYLSNPWGDIQPPFRAPLDEQSFFKRYLDAENRGLELYIQENSGKELEEMYKYLLSLPVVSEKLSSILEKGLPLPTYQIDHCAFFSKGFLLFITYQQVPELHDIFKRFAKVFEQTYTRFLDLQKAEAQAREAQIEAALERIRSASMAMHKSEELPQVALTFLTQIEELAIPVLGVALSEINPESNTCITYFADNTRESKNRELIISKEFDINEFWMADESIKQMKSGKEIFTLTAEGERLDLWIEWIDKIFSKERAERLRSANLDKVFFHSFQFHDYSSILFSSLEPMSEEYRPIIQRLVSTFKLSYLRFLDLKKAEAQAREAQIEAALEKVRSRTLAMQSSDELAETAAVLFAQLIGLGVHHERINIGIVSEENQKIEFWSTEQGGNIIKTKFEASIQEPTVIQKLYQGWKEGKGTLTVQLKGEELDLWVRYCENEIGIPFDKTLLQDQRVQSAAFFSKGMLMLTTPSLPPDSTIELLERFAYVFNLTFTRFNDLKIAEANALKAEKDLIAIKEAKKKAEHALSELKAAQEQLVQQEKLASLGQLTAGIAHEIKNPLNFVNNFSDLSRELIEEVFEELENLEDSETKEEIIAILGDVKNNLSKVHEHGTRADSIVKSMLQHSRASNNKMEPKAINPIIREFVNLAFHGMRAAKNPINVTIDLQLDEQVGELNIISEDFSRVILNLCNNAFDAMRDKLQAKANEGYEAILTVKSYRLKGKVILEFKDNGPGIPDEIRDKILQPFFTTKKGTEGTGLGLSITHDIIKAHGGELKVDSQKGSGSTFTIILPS